VELLEGVQKEWSGKGTKVQHPTTCDTSAASLSEVIPRSVGTYDMEERTSRIIYHKASLTYFPVQESVLGVLLADEDFGR
jgi:hypothetical protein